MSEDVTEEFNAMMMNELSKENKRLRSLLKRCVPHLKRLSDEEFCGVREVLQFGTEEERMEQRLLRIEKRLSDLENYEDPRFVEMGG